MTEWVSGNIFIRPSGVLQAGEGPDGHAHNFDHTTIVFTGAVRVVATLPNGAKIERDFEAPGHFLVRADVRHDIKALRDGTQFWCVYSHRNPQGDVVQHFDGWGDAYV